LREEDASNLGDGLIPTTLVNSPDASKTLHPPWINRHPLSTAFTHVYLHRQ
jgi:hypothetical protein